MKIVLLLVICALVFLVCFLVDKLVQKLWPKSDLEKSKNVVRPARRSVIIGILLLFAAALTAVFVLPREMDVIVLLGCIVSAIFGVILLVSYFSVAIYFDEEQFQYQDRKSGKKVYRYEQIRGQRSLMTRGGIHTTLFVGEDTIPLYGSMQNLACFLEKAFFKWCRVKQIDPDTVENNPRMLTWFPDPENAGKK